MDGILEFVARLHPSQWQASTPVWIAVTGLSLGALLGVFALFAPYAAAQLTRLQPNPGLRGGVAEFRATYGGVYLASHGVALALCIPFALGVRKLGDVDLPWTAMGACLVCGALWIGGAVGRLVTIFVDRAGSGANQLAVAVDIAIGVAILYPWIMRALVFFPPL